MFVENSKAVGISFCCLQRNEIFLNHILATFVQRIVHNTFSVKYGYENILAQYGYENILAHMYEE